MSQTSAPTTSTTNPESWLSCAEMAVRVGTSKRTIQRLCQDKRIAHHVLPGTTLIRFSPEDVAAFDAEARKVPA